MICIDCKKVDSKDVITPFRAGRCNTCYMRKRRAEEKQELENKTKTQDDQQTVIQDVQETFNSTGSMNGIDLNNTFKSFVEALELNAKDQTLASKVQELESKVQELSRSRVKDLNIKIDGTDIGNAGVQHYMFPKILALISNRVNTCLVGPAGTGKTTMCKEIAKLLNLNFYYTGTIYEPYSLLGYKDANGVYHRTPFRDAVEYGGLFLIDEMDRSIPKALTAFNATLDNGFAVFPDVGVIEVHKDFIPIASANTILRGATQNYSGASNLDGSTIDRFAIVELDYDEDLEIVWANPQSDKENDFITKVQSIRKAIKNLQLDHIVSPRASINGCKMLRSGFSEKDCLAMFVFKGIDSGTIAKIYNEVSENVT